MQANPSVVTVDHARWAEIARRGWLLMVASSLLGGWLGLVVAGVLGESYVVLADVRLAGDIAQQASAGAQADSRRAANELADLASPSRVSQTSSAAGDDVALAAELMEGSDTARVTAVSRDRSAATAAVSSLVEEYVERRGREQRELIDTARSPLTSRLGEVADSLPDASSEARAALLSERSELELRLAALDEDVSLAPAAPAVVTPPFVRSGTSSSASYALVGAVVGLLVGAVLAVVHERVLGTARGRDHEVMPGILGVSLDLGGGDWQDIPDDERRAYAQLALHAGSSGRFAVVGEGVGGRELVRRFASAVAETGSSPLLVLLGRPGADDLASTSRVRGDFEDVVTAPAVRVEDISSGLSASRQAEELRALLARVAPDDLAIVEAGSAREPTATMVSRADVPLVVAVPPGARLGVLRRRVGQLCDLGGVVHAVVVVRDKGFRRGLGPRAQVPRGPELEGVR